MSDQKPREIAARVLRRRGTDGGLFVENLLEAALAEASLPPADRALCQELVYGVVRWQAALDWLIARKSRSTAGKADRSGAKSPGAPVHQQKPMLQILLRLGLYQIFWLDRIPNHAAVFETVELAKRNGFGPQSGFVNAVLRGYLREFDATRQTLAELKNNEPHVGYSHPAWLVNRWQSRWGRENAAKLMDWNNQPARTFARVNTLKTDSAALITKWREEDVDYDFVRREWLEENLVFELKSHPPLTKLASFRNGFFYVQDPSTLLAPSELNPQPGEAILDLCAAPGGKATYLAQQLRNQGRIVANDVSENRLRLVEENCARLGVTCVQRAVGIVPAGGVAGGMPTARFDRILIDAPCSNTGVMRRRVDLRWRIRPEEIERLRVAQLELLQSAAPLLKPKGVLVYSTCSLEPEENSEVVKRFLEMQPGFRLIRERCLTPFADEVDGAFVAQLVR